ncbi:hypothetical protein KI387_033839, partial [Taxus chinensis]
ETKMKAKILEISKKKFWENSDMAAVDSQGASGGLATLWDKRHYTGMILNASTNHLAIKFHAIENNSEWILSNIYAPNTVSGRRKLWTDLKIFRTQHTTTNWLIMGDFNSPLNPGEKYGGISSFSTGMEEFVDFVADLNLLDVDLHGNKYTWNNRRLGKDLIQVRLDRALISASWILSQDFHLSSLPRIGSDHNPIDLNLLNWNKPIKAHSNLKRCGWSMMTFMTKLKNGGFGMVKALLNID